MGAFGVVDFDFVLAPVADVDVAIGVDGDVAGAVEFAWASAGLANGLQEAALGGELLDTVVAPIGYVDVVAGVYGDAPGLIEFAVAGTGATECQDKVAVAGELGDAIVALFRDIKVLVGVEDHAGGSAKFSRLGAASAPLAEEVFLFDIGAVEFDGCVEDGDSVQPLVGDVGKAVAVDGDGGGPDEAPA